MLNAELFFFHRGPETEPFQHPVQFTLIAADEIFRSGIILQTERFRAVQRIDQQNVVREIQQGTGKNQRRRIGIECGMTPKL